jgi:S-adenosylmethionine:tRNA ribosyltransferase-isomerase
VKISDFDYPLPPELIAQYPSEHRDQSRLMVVDRAAQSVQHHRFQDLPRFLSSSDLLILNNTRVIPARMYAYRLNRQEKIEVLLLGPVEGDVWEALVRPGKKAGPGTHLVFQSGQFEARVLESPPSAVRRLRFEYSGDLWHWIEKVGQTPLPPYIARPSTPEDRERYQTVFASIPGSVAAPTAGLHFTPELLEQIPHCEITLRVGYGTFKPVSAETVGEHRMDAEYYEIGSEAATRIMEQKSEGGRLIAVGTTTTRVLEHVFSEHQEIVSGKGWTDLFIRPGFDFGVIQGLITNFHLPRSTLLLLVSAFAGKELILECYREAVERGYRFYSYGDAMLIL